MIGQQGKRGHMCNIPRGAPGGPQHVSAIQLPNRVCAVCPLQSSSTYINRNNSAARIIYEMMVVITVPLQENMQKCHVLLT